MKNTDKLFELAQTDAILVISDKNRLYFTGFQSTFGYLLLLKGNKNVFITDPRYYEMAQELQSETLDVVQIANGISAKVMLADIFHSNNVKSIGFEDTELTVAEFSTLKQDLAAFELVPVGNRINFVRSYKDATEIEFIKRAQSVTDAAFKDILGILKAGMTEKELAVELEYRMAKHGAEGLAFDTIIASGVNSSKPHAHPTDKVIENGDPVTMDFGASYHGYCSDMTRTVFVGEPSAEMRKIYEVVLAAQCNGIQKAHCGMSGKEMDSYCRSVIEASGYGQYFTHSTGHSLGLDIHEEPRASVASTQIFEAGQLITCEPGIYIPGLGGVRIEDLLLVQEDEIIDLTKSDKNVIIL